ncbi:hypothetical protein C2G38_2211755 [Gigaspora rosea]|uniref:Uncharacterized protein n=1 Tax=Gigaspora rosea TaxID=44941 RepID=A0A397UH49_9GLOM|nr:hypothetical protein C2G38_2211755 [Gigaspora rosea]
MPNEIDNVIFVRVELNIEKALSIWINQIIVSELTVSEVLIFKKAHYFATTIEANNVLLKLLLNICTKLRSLIAKYQSEDVFNADETKLFLIRIEPNQILSFGLFTKKKGNKVLL